VLLLRLTLSGLLLFGVDLRRFPLLHLSKHRALICILSSFYCCFSSISSSSKLLDYSFPAVLFHFPLTTHYLLPFHHRYLFFGLPSPPLLAKLHFLACLTFQLPTHPYELWNLNSSFLISPINFIVHLRLLPTSQP